MKKITLCLMLILALMLPGVVQATDVSTEKVAKIGENEYATIAEALEAVPTDGTKTTITLLKDVQKGTGFKIVSGQNVVIDFGGFTYDAAEPLVGSTGTVTNGCQLREGATVTFENGTLTTTSGDAFILIQNYSDLTLNNMTIDSTDSASKYAMSNNNGKVNIIGETSIKGNQYAFDMCWAPNKGYPNGTQITVNTTGKIEGDIELGVWGTYDDTDEITSTLTIENINHIGNIVVSDEKLANQLTITGGTFSTNVSDYIPTNYECQQAESNYVVKKIVTQEVQIPNAVEDAEKVEDILLESLKENQNFEGTIEDNNIEVEVKVEENKVEEIEKEKIQEALKEEIKVAKYFDITISVTNKDTGVVIGTLDELTEKIKFTIEIPEDLPKVEEGLVRKYYIVRNHDGIVEYLDVVLSEDGKNLSFETDKFSTYALAYTDVANTNEKDNTPKTGAINVPVYAWLAVATIALVGIVTTKKPSKHSK